MPGECRRLLALDTATENCSAALWLDGEIHLRSQMSARDHAGQILPMVDALLAEAGLALNRLDAVAFGRGPGGFTGVRIATSVAHGLALGAGLPLVPVSDLQALAWRAWQRHGWSRVLVAMDARMQELYTSACELTAPHGACTSSREQVLAPSELVVPPGLWCGAGPGWAAYREALAGAAERLCEIDDGLFPDAGAVAALAAMQLRRTPGGVDVVDAQPVYLRDRVASPKPR